MNSIKKPSSQRSYCALIRHLLPAQGHWTDEDYLWVTDSSNRAIELNDGWIEPLPWPTTGHQSILGFLLVAFHHWLKPRGGKVHFLGLRLQLRPGRFRAPDLLMLLDAKDPRRENRYWKGADAVAEIVSADDPKRDLFIKKREYAQAGYREYWIVNPLNQTITVYRLDGKRYVVHGRFRRGQTATSALLNSFSVDVNAVFDAD